MMKRLTSTLLLALLFLAGCAPAAYEEWDVDNDSYLAEDEVEAGVFDDWDTDDDSYLSEDEWGVADTGVFEDDWNDFGVWDDDNDGLLSDDEWGVGFDESGVFDDWDTDDDGLLSDDEIGDAGII